MAPLGARSTGGAGQVLRTSSVGSARQGSTMTVCVACGGKGAERERLERFGSGEWVKCWIGPYTTLRRAGWLAAHTGLSGQASPKGPKWWQMGLQMDLTTLLCPQELLVHYCVSNLCSSDDEKDIEAEQEQRLVIHCIRMSHSLIWNWTSVWVTRRISSSCRQVKTNAFQASWRLSGRGCMSCACSDVGSSPAHVLCHEVIPSPSPVSTVFLQCVLPS